VVIFGLVAGAAEAAGLVDEVDKQARRAALVVRPRALVRPVAAALAWMDKTRDIVMILCVYCISLWNFGWSVCTLYWYRFD